MPSDELLKARESFNLKEHLKALKDEEAKIQAELLESFEKATAKLKSRSKPPAKANESEK